MTSEDEKNEVCGIPVIDDELTFAPAMFDLELFETAYEVSSDICNVQFDGTIYTIQISFPKLANILTEFLTSYNSPKFRNN